MEIVDYTFEKFLTIANYETNKELIKSLVYIVLENLGVDKDDIEIASATKRNNSSETGPGGMYQIYDYRETYSIMANRFGFKVEITDKKHEAYDIAWNGVYNLNSFALPNNYSANFELKDRCEFKISAKLSNQIIELITEKLTEIK